ncbi:MAG: hypothetical protein J6O13_09570 [Selenomonas sp.]|nr:hypothetical protein [Selenomonas sp.]MBO6203769.1 hypothetical protein [Selenomonas sp.]
MMAVSIKELIENKEAIEAAKKAQYDLETSVGTLTVKLPSRALVLEALSLDDSDSYIIVNSVVAPDLKDSKLLKTFECLEPTDLPEKLFQPGEVAALSVKIMQLAGYRKEIHAEIHETAKN